MRSELNGFVQYLKKRRVIDDGTEVRDLSDTLSALPKGHLGWRYKVGKSTIQLASSAVEWPKPARSLVCIMAMDIRGSVTARKGVRGEFDWLIDNLEMQLKFSADDPAGGEEWSQFWHFDTHIDRPDSKIPDEAHPRFHFHFGGGEMKNRRLNEKEDIWGRSLELHCPRLMHPPMDVVLAIDFILSNSTGPRWRHEFSKDKEYASAVCNAQDRFWRPYQNTVSDFFCCLPAKQQGHAAILYSPTLRRRES